MTKNKPKPFDQKPKSGTWPILDTFNYPIHEALAEFIHGNSEDISCRTAAVTTLVLSLWQLTGRGMSCRVPSLLLIGAEGQNIESVDHLAQSLLAKNRCSEPQIYTEGYFMHSTPEQAPVAMAGAVSNMLKERSAQFPDPKYLNDLEQRYFAAMRTGFGTGVVRNYSKAWNDVFQLLTDRDGGLILRLEDQADRVAFREDVTKKSNKLRAPIGYGPGLHLVPKTTSVSGAIPADMWDAEFAGGMVDLGLPMLFLPNPATAAPCYTHHPVLDIVFSALPKTFGVPVEEPTNFIQEQWFEIYGAELRKRLRYLPGDYEYCIQKLARQITPVCHRIASWCGRGASKLAVEGLWLDLCMHTLLGLVLSIVGLAWHGLGFDAGSSRADALRVLKYLRERGPMTNGNLLRAMHLQKEQRDTLVNQLTAENLIQIKGRTLTAVTYSEFVAAIYGRRDLPLPLNFWSEAAKKDKPAA